MDQNEQIRLEKAHDAAQFLLADLQEIHAKTNCVALEELIFPQIEQISKLSQLLGRLKSQK
jgi:hypothetical protein